MSWRPRQRSALEPLDSDSEHKDHVDRKHNKATHSTNGRPSLGIARSLHRAFIVASSQLAPDLRAVDQGHNPKNLTAEKGHQDGHYQVVGHFVMNTSVGLLRTWPHLLDDRATLDAAKIIVVVKGSTIRTIHSIYPLQTGSESPPFSALSTKNCPRSAPTAPLSANLVCSRVF